MLYPLKFDNIYQVMPWAGREFELFRFNLPEGIVGESWDVACHEEGTSVVANGQYKGKTLKDLISILGASLLGTNFANGDFPYMMRLICSRQKTSVHIHPDDGFAHAHGISSGKTEAWYVMEAFDGAFAYIGTRDCTLEEFRKAVHEGTVEKYLNKVLVRKGDMFVIPSGLVHALGTGTIVVEMGQNANTTYRIFDYHRGRPLDIEKALSVIDLSIQPRRSTSLDIQQAGFIERTLCMNRFFACIRYDIDGTFPDRSDSEKFHTLTCVEGNGLIDCDSGREFIRCGESMLFPADLGEYAIRGTLKVLKVYVPHLDFERDRLWKTVFY
jgi:mannose-6-phosphate isomerase